MLGRIRGWQRRHWKDRSKAERVELQTVITWYVTTWFFPFAWLALPLLGGLERRPAPMIVGGLLLLVAALQCVAANRLTRPVLDHYLKRSEFPMRALIPSAALTLAGLALALVLAALDGTDPVTVRLSAGTVLLCFGMLYGLLVPVRLFLRRSAELAVVVMALFGWTDPHVGGIVMIGVITAFGACFSLFACRCSAWNLSVLWEAERAGEVEARLAVAEERLRFGRDLHDVMGRNLAVIALKSELAVQLARRGRPEAVEQMIEVQRIAQESQREVREVVRGYREADLGVELAGAQGVLTAAGIACEVRGEAGGLPAGVQSALGWVVREATTNVLRHGDAGRCSVGLRVTEGRVVLTVENDGAERAADGVSGAKGAGAVSGAKGAGTVSGTKGAGGAGAVRSGAVGLAGSTGTAGGTAAARGTGSVEGTGGSGLAGLRERLRRVDGTLEAGFAGAGVFRVMAEVPLDGARGAESGTGAGARSAESGPGTGAGARAMEAAAETGAGTGAGTGTGTAVGSRPGPMGTAALRPDGADRTETGTGVVGKDAVREVIS
ncbi:sensor histidine kinase [Streptomyces antibioticus]|uniref:sensor histidine kinase n=1 Tax=Streptomyces antibioticus TaxID=1890 RepID=UPI002258290E|nr:histidine kinase [Streptomyces antibioticus]MCX4738168.1 histidine kinase [Streptomyces antibioticus]